MKCGLRKKGLHPKSSEVKVCPSTNLLFSVSQNDLVSAHDEKKKQQLEYPCVTVEKRMPAGEANFLKINSEVNIDMLVNDMKNLSISAPKHVELLVDVGQQESGKVHNESKNMIFRQGNIVRLNACNECLVSNDTSNKKDGIVCFTKKEIEEENVTELNTKSKEELKYDSEKDSHSEDKIFTKTCKKNLGNLYKST